MSNDIPKDLRYTQSHEWVRVEDDGSIVVGITHYAQESLGELVFVDVPEIDATVDIGDDIAVVESVKAASDIYAPVAGTVAAINGDLEDAPGLVNSDPYGDGWIYKLQPKHPEEIEQLMSATDYESHLHSEEA